MNTQIRSKADRGVWYLERWAARYLKAARERLSAQLPGFDLTIEDVYAMQQTCAYEVWRFPMLREGNRTNKIRPLHLDIPNSASCSPKRNGKDSTMRKFSVLRGLEAKLT